VHFCVAIVGRAGVPPWIPTIPTMILWEFGSLHARILRRCNPIHTVATLAIFRDLVLPRPPLSWKHSRRARVHSFSGGGTLFPLFGVISSLGGEGCVSPPFCLHACTLFMLVLCEARGVFRDLPARFSEIVFQIPLETTIFRGAYPAGGGEAAWFELSCNLHNGR